ncbi:MAG: methyl-accepting chemotaxis protein [Aeromonadaceae bacterium]
MKKPSLKQKILLSVITTVVVVVFLLSWLSFSALKSQTYSSSFAQLQSIGVKSAEGISRELQLRRTVIEALAEHLQGASGDLMPVLHLAKRSGQFNLAYYGDKDGVMHDAEPGFDRSNYDPRVRPWYQQAMQANGLIITKPYIGASSKQMQVTIAKPAANGVVGGDMLAKGIMDSISQTQLPAEGYALLLHRDGSVISYRDTNKILKPATEIDPQLTPALIEQLKQASSLTDVTLEQRDKLLWAVPVPESDWDLLFVLDKAALNAPLWQQLWSQMAGAAVVLVLALLAIGALVGFLFRPLGVVSAALARIADGSGDLRQRIEIRSDDEIGQLAANFNKFVGSLATLIAHIREEAVSLSGIAQRALQGSVASVNELGRQQQEVAMVVTAVTEMASATQEIAGNAEQTALASNESSQSCVDGQALVNKTRSSINNLACEVGEATQVIAELSRHAHDISGVLATIQGIAEQTNLLALNAAIEAARAGDQGRGFAVVADEVRVLSKRTQSSTTEIQSTIETLQRTTQQAVAMMSRSQDLAQFSVQDAEKASAAIDEITRAVGVISDMSTQIATAAEEQTKVTEEITANVTAIKDVGDSLALGADARHAAAQELQRQADSLNSQVARFIL